MVNWNSNQWGEAITVLGASGDTLPFQSVVVVIIDNHNALIDNNHTYLGVCGNEQALEGYGKLL
ncbi:MAG: hypothetical protein ACKPKO_09825, partial [Candidatus Fonsibacter sp.]